MNEIEIYGWGSDLQILGIDSSKYKKISNFSFEKIIDYLSDRKMDFYESGITGNFKILINGIA
jgi:hypothetical protein